VFASHPEAGAKISLDPHELIKGKRIYGTWGGDVNPDEDAQVIADYLSKSGANLDLLIGDLFTIDEVNEGLAYLDSGKPGRPILNLNEV
jgi:S-(hydroxymethyl)glutathione dehydrogenase/alcohol dehydrogenase